jgi:2-polyprenyl-3-methyl-5-hydroxy-6-metoxy-1,4-benzoquinol methylase
LTAKLKLRDGRVSFVLENIMTPANSAKIADSVTNVELLNDGDKWIDVFRQRGVWSLTPDIVSRWVARNPQFFGMIKRMVPQGARTLELGCGPGRHALGAATLGYNVVGIDVDPEIVAQAQSNCTVLGLTERANFRLGDMFRLEEVGPKGSFDAITHGGVMEHLGSAQAIRDTLRDQLSFAPVVIFDIPFDSPKNRALFRRDDIFRQMWTAETWIDHVLAGLPVVQTAIDLHAESNMTDDLVVALSTW